MSTQLNDVQRAANHEDGYIIIIPQFLNEAETALLHHLSVYDSIVDKCFDLIDQTGKKTHLTLFSITPILPLLL